MDRKARDIRRAEIDSRLYELQSMLPSPEVDAEFWALLRERETLVGDWEILYRSIFKSKSGLPFMFALCALWVFFIALVLMLKPLINA